MTTSRDQFLEIKKNYDRLLEQDLNFGGDAARLEEFGRRMADALQAVMLMPAADLRCIQEKLTILSSDWKQMVPLSGHKDEREHAFLAAIKADVTALGAIPANTLGGTEPMTTTPTTLICTLAREAAQLRADLRAAEDESHKLRTGPLTDATIKQRDALDEFQGEAGDRLDAIEAYIATLRPQSLQDALILTAMAAQFAQQRVSDEDRLHAMRRAVTRITANVAAFLEAETGTTAAALGVGGFGDVIRPFSETAPEARAILAELRHAKAA